mgnify:CR=1 FL=1
MVIKFILVIELPKWWLQNMRKLLGKKFLLLMKQKEEQADSEVQEDNKT